MTAESQSTLERAFEIRLDDSPFRVLLGEQVRLCGRPAYSKLDQKTSRSLLASVDLPHQLLIGLFCPSTIVAGFSEKTRPSGRALNWLVTN